MTKNENYHTKARQEILNYLRSCWASPVSASDILQHLKEIGTPVNPTTVYRYLNKLCSDHVLIKYVASKGQKAVYQLAEQNQNCSEHLHLKCSRCGKIIHLDNGFMEEFRRHLQTHHDFQLQCEGSMLYGVCQSCLFPQKRQ